MPRCIARGCGSTAGTPGVKTHNVPSSRTDLSLRKQWLRNAGRLDLLNESSKIVVCNRHFTSKCYQKDMMAEMMEGKLKYKLISGSIPTIFQSTISNKQNVGVMSAMEDHRYLPLDQEPPIQVNIPSATSVFPTCNQKKKQCSYGRALNDISNTHPTKKSSRIITSEKMVVKEVEVQTMTIETRSFGTQTCEEDVLSQISLNHVDLSEHSYSAKPKVSTPVKVTTMEPMDLDMSTIEAPAVIDDNLSSSDSSDSSMKDDKKADPDFVLESSSSSISSDESMTDVNNKSISEKTFIVFGCALEMLMSLVLCSICGADTMITSMCIVGTKLIVDFHCINNHDFTWKSQPDAGKMAKGNIVMASAILLSGASFNQVNRMSKLMSLAFITKSSFNRIQRKVLFGIINGKWLCHQSHILSQIEGSVKLAGDGRCDSPGFSSKYGTYTLMSLKTGHVLDFYVTQCTEAGNSVNMEKFGLIKCLENLRNKNIVIDTLATDRHIQIRSYLKKSHPEINHQFDIWHLARSIGKKIRQKGKSKNCEILNDWRKCIVNHFWYACSICEGNVNVLIECWLSILHHSTNRHVFPGNYFTSCKHPVISCDKRTKWLKPESEAFKALKEIICNKRLIEDIKQCSGFCHTGGLESYHSLITMYCPKRIHYGMEAMNARTQLAALDHNHNVNREHATIKKGPRKGDFKYRTECPKMSGEWVAKKVYVNKKYDHFHELVEKAVECQASKTYPRMPDKRNLPKNISRKDKPNKSDIVAKHVSRFARN